MNTFKSYAAAATFACAFAVAIAVPGTAAHAGSKASATISYADLNLASETGRDVLDRRIDRAVEKVCGALTRNISMDASARECQRETRLAANKSRDVAVAEYANKRLAKASAKVIRLNAN